MAEKKNPLIALASSGLIPGAGEFYLGSEKRGGTFLGLAIIGWGSYFFTGSRINSYQDEYEELAYLYAGIDEPKFGYDDETYKLMSKWESSDYYKNRFDPSYAGIDWNWMQNTDTEEKWQEYRNARASKVDAENLQKGLKGAIIFVHALSAIDALIATRLHNKSVENFSFDVDIQDRHNPILRVALKRNF